MDRLRRRKPCIRPPQPIDEENEKDETRDLVGDGPECRRVERRFSILGLSDVKKRLNAMSQFLDHLAYDAMPVLLDRLSSQKGNPLKEMP